MIGYGQAIILGLLQGFSELFPISSLGHSVILPRLLGWDIHQNDDFFITFLVATHLATALVLLGFFWKDWVRIVKGIGRSLRDRQHRPGRSRREARLAPGRRHDPGGRPRPAPRAPPAQPVRLSGVRGVLPDDQRPAALRGRAPAPARARPRGRRLRRANRRAAQLARGGRRRDRAGARAHPRHLAHRA